MNKAAAKTLRVVLRVVSRVALVAFFCTGLFMRCANRLTPQGGPKDSLPPAVVSMTPPMGTRNMTDRRIFIQFDEYIQLKDQSKAFFTSPFMKTKPTLSIRGRGVRIDINDTLRENQTYALNFGSAVRDNNEGNILHGLRFVFSTGPAIDSMIMTGYAADAMKGDSVSRAFIFFYDAKIDSIPQYDSTLLKYLPDAVGRAENNGIFIAQNLRPIDYKVYAVGDNNGNQRYDPGVDKVGFLDSVYNPAHMGPFAIWLDEFRRYPTADPQVFFRMFTDGVFKRHNLTNSERPGRHQAILRFSAPFPRIDTLKFEGIPDERVIREYLSAGRDTISLWFDMPPDALPDTIKGRISYLRHDSINNLVPHSQQLRLAWRYIETKEEERERKKEEKERDRAEAAGEEYIPPKKPNPFRFKVDAGAEINPEKNIAIQFDMPLVRLDTAQIVLSSLADPESPRPVPFRIERDTMNIRRWTISADWNPDSKYRLLVPAGTFVNVAGEQNDTLRSDFGILQKSKFASLVIDVTGKTPESKYVLQVVNKSNKVEREVPFVSTGKYILHFIPDGEVRLRIVEDMNGNGSWDTGNLIERRQPERVEFYVTAGSQLIPTRMNWEVDIALDMARIFEPITIERVRRDLQKAEDARIAKWREDRAKREAERLKQQNQQGSAGGLGIGGALGGAKQQIQSAAGGL